MATVQCNCGDVKLQFASPKVLWRLECCCYNCITALKYQASQGGPPAPALQCLDSNWFCNDFKILQGEDKIGARAIVIGTRAHVHTHAHSFSPCAATSGKPET